LYIPGRWIALHQQLVEIRDVTNATNLVKSLLRFSYIFRIYVAIYLKFKMVSLSFKPALCRGVNYSEKSVRRFLGLENPSNFPRDSGIFFPNLRDFGIFSADFFEIFFPYFFFAELFPKFFATYNPSNSFKTK
jgi:hypothetical protein